MATPRRIAVLTGSRAEYGLLYWTIRAVHQDPDLELLLLVTGMHLSPEFGLTVGEIEADGFPIAARVEMLLSSDTGVGTATSMGLGTVKMAQSLEDTKPDILVVLGDRPEVLATVVAALPQLIPVAHIHAGESSEGVIDESIRHAVTKLSHLYFVATDHYAKRLLQMGEEEWRIQVCGATGLEHIYRTSLPSREEVEEELDLDLTQPTLLVTQHPVTIGARVFDAGASAPDDTSSDVAAVLGAVAESGLPAVITYPNSDMGGRAIIEDIQAFEAQYTKAKVRVNLGTRLYLGLLRYSAAMVGNSSSGIIEAASFGLPVVNVGERQQGRLRGSNVVDVPTDKDAILQAIQQVLEPGFRQKIAGLPNPYDRGESSQHIVRVLKETELGRRLLQKRLPDLPAQLAMQPETAGV